MDIFEAVIDEIALSGLEGCTPKELWYHLSNRKCPSTFPLALDEQAKCYIWSLLHEASAGIVNFYVLKSARQFHEDNLTFTYRLVSDSGIRGSCWEYDTREDVTSAILNDDTSGNLSQVITRYGDDQLVMVAIQEVRVKALSVPSMNPMYSINDVQYCALEAVGRAREKGILRIHLTNKFLKIDPRSTYHHVGILQSIGAITIKVHAKGYQLFLTRYSAYADQLDWETNNLEKISNMLLQAPNQCLPESEIARELGNIKRYRRVKTNMLSKGLVEVVKPSDGEVDESQLRLIKPSKRIATTTVAAADPMGGEGLDLEEPHDDHQEGSCALQKHYVVAEKLFEMQACRVVSSAGPSGMTSSEFYQSVQGVDYNTKKITLANIAKQGCVVSVLIDDDKVKKYRYISRHEAGKSSDIEKLKSEAKKTSHSFTLAIRSKDASLIEQDTENASTPTATSGSLELPATSLMEAESTLGGDDSVVGEDAEVEGILKNASHDIGTPGRADSATSTPTLITEVNFHKRMEVKGIPLRKMERINFILECIETEKVILSKFILYKKMIEFESQKGIAAKIDRKTHSKLLQSLVDKGMVNVKIIQLPSKFEHSIYYHSNATETQLSEAIAEAQALYGFKESANKKKTKQQAQKSTENGDSNDIIITIPETLLDLKDDGFILIPAASKFQRLHHLHLFLWILQYGLPNDAKLSSVTFPWIPAVSKVDNIEDRIRWRMMVNNMPLSLLIIIVGVNQKRMPIKLYKFIQRPENRNLMLRQLPKSIQLYINAKKRDVVRIYELLQMLEDMKLAIIHQPTAKFIKINVEVELFRSCSILDTSSIEARHSFFLEECRSKLPSVTFQFDSVNDLQAYWFKLKSVCMMTKIFKSKGDLPPDDEGALPLPELRKVTKDYNKLGFGAGGLPPLMYSHIMYNWGTMTFFKSEQELLDSAADDKPILPEITYTDLPVVLPSDSPHDVKGQSHDHVLSGRLKRKLVTLDGGSATVSAAKRVKRAASQKLHKKNATLNKKVKLLVWSKEEDGVLMRCHVALSVLNARGLAIPTPIEMREIIRDWTPNRLKHGIAIQRHMNDICSRDNAVCELLKTCVDQLQHTIEMGCGPPLNFKSLLHYLIDNYTGCVPVFNVAASSATAPPTTILPVTLQELKGSCEVCAPHESGLLLPPVRAVSDVRKSMLIDLIIAVMGAGSDCYNEYTAFHLFEEYLEQELEDAIALLKSGHLVKQRRSVDCKSKNHLGPSATQVLVLHNNFYSRLESSFPCQLFEDICTHLASLGSTSTESAPKEEEWTPGGGEIAVKLHALVSSNYFCSSAVHSFISNLASCDVQLSSCYFVGKQNVPDIPLLDDEDDEYEDDDKENTRMEKMITACLPYHTSIHIPDNRNFSDLTFRHGYTVGSLLAYDDSNPSGPYPTDDSQCLMDATEHSTECNRECVVDSTEGAVDYNGAAVGDHMEHSTEMMEYNVGNTLDNTEPMADESRVCDHVEYSVEHDAEHNVEHTVDNSRRTVEQTQGHTIEHSMEHSVVENNEGTAGHVKYDPQLSIDEYLQLCTEHLKYYETDVMFAKCLYDTICHAGVMGVPLRQLEQCYHIGITMTTSEHLQQLKNFEMVIEVGIQVVRLVAAEHKKVWLLHMGKQRSPDDHQQFTKCRPWTSLHGQEFTGMYQRMQDAVLFYIMDYPGVTLHALEHHFNGIMQLNSLRDILDVLIVSGCISCHRMIREGSCDLFSSSKTIVAPSGLHDDIPSNVYFEPVSGCEVVYASNLLPSHNAV